MDGNFPHCDSNIHCYYYKLRSTFARYGLPQTIVTDNSTCQEFEYFLKSLGIQHITTAPYHPQYNGMSERCVQIFKKSMKKITKGTLDEQLSNILFTYCITPQSTTGQTPSELMFGLRIPTNFDLLNPNDSKELTTQKPVKEKNCSRFTSFQPGQLVYAKNFHQVERWLPAKVCRVVGNVMYELKLEKLHKVVRRHVNQICNRSTLDFDIDIDRNMINTPNRNVESNTDTPGNSSVPQSRYPSQIRIPPDHYGTYVCY